MKLLSSEEAQETLGISRPTLYLWVRQGKLTPQRAGRGLRFEEDQVHAGWMIASCGAAGRKLARVAAGVVAQRVHARAQVGVLPEDSAARAEFTKAFAEAGY